MGATHIGLVRYICYDHGPITSIRNVRHSFSTCKIHAWNPRWETGVVGKLYYKTKPSSQ